MDSADHPFKLSPAPMVAASFSAGPSGPIVGAALPLPCMNCRQPTDAATA